MNAIRSSTVNNWGQSLGVRLPADFVKAINLEPNMPISISLENERIVIAKVKKRRTIKEIFAEQPSDFLIQDEIEWGEVIGDEIW